MSSRVGREPSLPAQTRCVDSETGIGANSCEVPVERVCRDWRAGCAHWVSFGVDLFECYHGGCPQAERSGAKYAAECMSAHIHHYANVTSGEGGKNGWVARTMVASRLMQQVLTGMEIRADVAKEEERRRAMAESAEADDEAALQAHKPLCLNIEDRGRCAAVPKREENECGDAERARRKFYNFRDFPGVVSHPSKTGAEGEAVGLCCAGHW